MRPTAGVGPVLEQIDPVVRALGIRAVRIRQAEREVIPGDRANGTVRGEA